MYARPHSLVSRTVPTWTPKRRAWLEGIADRVPRLLDAIREGNYRSEFILGERQIDGRRVRLTLRAETITGPPIADDGEPLPELATLAPRRESDAD